LEGFHVDVAMAIDDGMMGGVTSVPVSRFNVVSLITGVDSSTKHTCYSVAMDMRPRSISIISSESGCPDVSGVK
jgi:hypothetical protein